MWTVKRILILVIGLLVTLCSFAIYTVFLGVIDGVQPLPIHYLPGPPTEVKEPLDPIIEFETDHRLKLAFGANCKELQRPLRLWLPDKGIAFAAGEFVIDKEGNVRLAPFSAAFYQKSALPGAYPEISTIRSDVAILTLDKPVTQMSELNSRKVIRVEMVGRQPHFITLTSNRRSAEKNDDVDVLITNGSLFYVEHEDRIFTDGVVCLTDHQSKPPMVISGKGLDMYLAKNSGPSATAKSKKRPVKQSNDTGNIDKIALRSDVDMRLWTDPSSGFLGTPGPKKEARPLSQRESGGSVAPGAPADDKPIAEKELVHIRTGGPFVYDLTKEFAWFESPPTRESAAAKGADAFAPDQVHVHRVQKVKGGEMHDQLTCDRLELQFRVRPSASGANNNSAGRTKEIETANATRRNVNEVTLSSDSNAMVAFGNEMFYRAGDATHGPLTILKGEPNRQLRTAKDGHKMWCQELHLFAADRYGEGQRAWAKGPGQIDLLDSNNPNKNSFPTHVFWRDTLTVVKEKEGGQVYDLMTVVGEASFIDDLQKQELHGEKIVVWLEQTQESAKKPEAMGGGRQELRRVLAVNRVRAASPDFIVRRSNYLMMLFIPEMARNEILPDLPAPINKKNTPAAVPGLGAKNSFPATQPGVVAKPALEEKKTSPPIELEGDEITVAISTLGAKKEVQELIAKGAVHVFQAGEKKGEKALDITGTLLTVKHAEKGHTMIVYGEKDKLAQVEMSDTIIWGPIVTVNQADNYAEVDGLGAMDMPSNKNLDGTASTKKSSRIRIDWKKNMTFDGRYATFYGGVQAREHGAHSQALCENLTAKLDNYVSFKDGQKDKQNAKIDRLIFDRNVFIEDYKFDEAKQPLQYNKGKGTVLINEDNGFTRFSGPGWVRLLAKGSPDQGQAPQKAAPPKQEWKLTHVKFRDSMTSNTKSSTKKATFYGMNTGVEVFHFPTLNIDDNMDPDHLKKDQMHLRCDILEVEGKQSANRTIHTMIARTNVYFRTDQYLGYSDLLKYDENSDIVIFEGLNGNNVRLYKMVDGRPVPASVNSRKVLYNRKTGQIDSEGVKSITN